MLSHCLDGLCPILYSFNLFDSLHWSGFKFYSFKILFFLVYSDNLSHPCEARKLLCKEAASSDVEDGTGSGTRRDSLSLSMDVFVSLLAWHVE